MNAYRSTTSRGLNGAHNKTEEMDVTINRSLGTHPQQLAQVRRRTKADNSVTSHWQRFEKIVEVENVKCKMTKYFF
jgi:hypothetical protein